MFWGWPKILLQPALSTPGQAWHDLRKERDRSRPLQWVCGAGYNKYSSIRMSRLFQFRVPILPKKTTERFTAPTKIFVSGRLPDRLKQCLGEKGFRWGTWNDRFPAEASKEGRHQPDRGTSSESEEKGHPTRWILCYLAGSSTPDSLGRYWMSCLAQEY